MLAVCAQDKRRPAGQYKNHFPAGTCRLTAHTLERLIMAIGWLTILKTVPWADVISNAPKVADGAKKLWKTVAKKPAPHGATGTAAQSTGSAEAQASNPLEARLAEMETRTSELQALMLASSELIKSLAEQNAELVKRIEAIRIRVLWLGVATVVLTIMAATGLAGAALP